MTHWATSLMGKPWRPGATGPDAFDCWGLVRWVFEHRHCVLMPDVGMGLAHGHAANVAAIKRAAQASGWRRCDGQPLADDIVLMRSSIDGRRHVGLMVGANMRLGVLHANGYMRDGVPFGEVVFQPLREVTADGYGEHEFWRLATPAKATNLVLA